MTDGMAEQQHAALPSVVSDGQLAAMAAELSICTMCFSGAVRFLSATTPIRSAVTHVLSFPTPIAATRGTNADH